MEAKELHTSDGLVLHYEVQEGRAPYIIFIHGAGGNTSVWSEYAPLLGENGLLMVDLRGHGKTTLDAEWGFQSAVDDVYKILDQEKIAKAVIVGNCLGASMAVELARRYPDAVKKLVLISLFGSKYIRFSAIFAPLAAIAAYASPKRKSAVLINYQLHIERNAWTFPVLDLQSTSWHSYFSSMRDLFKYPLDVLKIRKPALIIQGRRDAFARNNAIYRHASARKNIKLSLVNTDHLVAIRAPAQVSALIKEFVNG